MITANRQTVLFAGICSLILCMGLGRYAFTPMIPVMQNQVNLSSSAAGWLAGIGYMGYLTGLFIAWLVSDLRLKDFFFRYGLVVSVIATAVMSFHEHVLLWGLSRFFSGVAAAAGFMFGAGLIVNWLSQRGHSIRLGVYFSGMGLGIVFSALSVELLANVLELNWRVIWLVLTVFAAMLLVPSLALIPMPQNIKSVHVDELKEVPHFHAVPSQRWLWLMQGAYLFAGFSNTMNVTFTSLMAELQPLPGMGARIWLVVGLAATPAPIIWEWFAKRHGYLDALILAFLVNVVGNLVLANTASLGGTLAASVLFGFSFLGIVSLTLATVGRRYREKSSQVMAQLTLGYCIAQVLSPIVTGIVAEGRGDFTLPIYGVAILMLCGMFFLLAARRVDDYRKDKPFFGKPDTN